VRRGVYRLVHFPPGEHEDLAVVWLWSDRAGVFSHETALSLHVLSDVLPSRVHLTVPSAWSRRRLRVPQGVVLEYGDVPKEDRTWVGPVQVTTVRRTLADCIAAGVAPDLVRQAMQQAAERGLLAGQSCGREAWGRGGSNLRRAAHRPAKAGGSDRTRMRERV
jgi:predicted transcriptional regulator of viral defense system